MRLILHLLKFVNEVLDQCEAIKPEIIRHWKSRIEQVYICKCFNLFTSQAYISMSTVTTYVTDWGSVAVILQGPEACFAKENRKIAVCLCTKTSTTSSEPIGSSFYLIFCNLPVVQLNGC